MSGNVSFGSSNYSLEELQANSAKAKQKADKLEKQEQAKEEVGNLLSGEAKNYASTGIKNEEDFTSKCFDKMAEIDLPDEEKTSFIDSVKSFFTSKKADKASSADNKNVNSTEETQAAEEGLENVNPEDIKAAMDYVKAHPEGFDTESDEFKALPNSVQSYVTSKLNQAAGQENKNDANKIKQTDVKAEV